jgi:hypothetical protein
MSHYYASIQGPKGAATRCGTKGSGISTHVRTWDFGIKVIITHRNGRDIAEIYQTTGSNGTDRDSVLLMIARNDGHL